LYSTDSSADETIPSDNGNESSFQKDSSPCMNTFAPIYHTCYGKEGFQLLHEKIFNTTNQWIKDHPHGPFTHYWLHCTNELGLHVDTDFSTTLQILKLKNLDDYYHLITNLPSLKNNFTFHWDNKIVYSTSSNLHQLPLSHLPTPDSLRTPALPTHEAISIASLQQDIVHLNDQLHKYNAHFEKSIGQLNEQLVEQNIKILNSMGTIHQHL
jgi:hypothetical protein